MFVVTSTATKPDQRAATVENNQQFNCSSAGACSTVIATCRMPYANTHDFCPPRVDCKRAAQQRLQTQNRTYQDQTSHDLLVAAALLLRDAMMQTPHPQQSCMHCMINSAKDTPTDSANSPRTACARWPCLRLQLQRTICRPCNQFPLLSSDGIHTTAHAPACFACAVHSTMICLKHQPEFVSKSRATDITRNALQGCVCKQSFCVILAVTLE